MKRPFLLSVLLLLGCAMSRGEGDLVGIPGMRTVTVGSVSPGGGNVSGTTTFRYEDQPILVEDVVDAGVGEVFPALLAAYRSEGLLADGIDPGSGIVSMSRAEWSGDRNGQGLSTFLDCGASATGRPLADAARVVAAIAAQVREAGTRSTRVTLRLSASAYPYENLGGSVTGCATTGELERAILERIRVALDPAEAEADPTAGAPRRATAEAIELPFSPGDRLRVRVSTSEPITGAFAQLRGDTLVLGTSRRTPIHLEQIQEIQVKRTRRSAMVVGILVGVVAGVTIASTTDLGIAGSHSAQGRMLNPGLGAMAGGLAGALVASLTFGSYWEYVPVGTVRPRSGGSP